MEYSFERIGPDNLHRLIPLFKSSFNYSADIDFLRRKFDTERFGSSYIGFLALAQNNTVAAYYGVFPITVEFKGQRILAAQSGDTMTHPDHRGKGLFITLAKMTYDLARSEKIAFIFGFPNKNSFPGFVKKLEWKHYANINNYRIETGSFPLDKVAKRYVAAKKIFEWYWKKKTAGIENGSVFANSLSHQLPEQGYVTHDEPFRNYKTYYASQIITVADKKCWVKADGRLWVGDIEACTKEEFAKVIRELKLLARRSMCATVHFSVNEGSLYDQWLRENFPVSSSDPIGCLDLNGITDPTRFAYQAVDFDTY